MSKAIKVRKGVDIKLVGVAETMVSNVKKSQIYSLKPADFIGLTPKLSVKEGDQVMAGTSLFYDKMNPEVKFASPVSGRVKEVKRGAKRKILEVSIEADAEIKYAQFTPWSGEGDKASLTQTMLDMGLWPFVSQRPFGVIANPTDAPMSVWISGFESAPLGADIPFLLKDRKEDLKTGVMALKTLCHGPIHISVRPGDNTFNDIEGVIIHTVSGPHPAGNVGVQIHNVEPINKGEVIWTVRPMDLALIGKSLSQGKFCADRVIALAGSEVNAPQYYSTMIGAQIADITEGKLKNEGNMRIISGNVLTGSNVGKDGSLGFYDNMITVIPEGDHKQFFLTEGWLAPGLGKFSLNKSYPSWLMPNKRYNLNTNLNGEHRAFVVTGELEKVFPFDIYPMQLVKAIMINDIDSMEKLGIYEVIPEDFALCEVVCTSKIEIQSIVAQGLEDLRKEFAS